MKLSKAQLNHIKNRRKWLDQRENDIRSFGDDMYNSRELVRELLQLGNEKEFFNFMIRLHNVEVDAEKASEVLKDGTVK